MTSNGGLAAPEFFRGKDAIASGPAGGVVGMAETARAAGFERVIGFDMGGTSTDVSRFDGAYERVYETEVAGVRLRVPMLAIHTVAAGGGSILHYDGARFRVGPDSAGADPGPMCYRRGGPLCVTDANVMVGKLRPEFFPHIFGPSADEPLDDAGGARRLCFARLRHRRRADRRKMSRTASSASPSRTWPMPSSASPWPKATMRATTRSTVSAARAASMPASSPMRSGISRIFIHPFSGVLSAYGMKLRAAAQRCGSARSGLASTTIAASAM